MKVFFCVAIAAAALSPLRALAQIGPIDEAVMVAVIDAQRARTGPAPGEGQLQWSDDLAGYAQAWAESLAATDQFNHRDSSPNSANWTVNNTLPCCSGQYLGENLFGTTAPDPNDGTIGNAAVANWIGEMQWYNYAADDGNGAAGSPPGCTAPQAQTCGHYTQVVWAATTQFGCGKATSASGWTYVACNFFPGGNIVGQKPF